MNKLGILVAGVLALCVLAAGVYVWVSIGDVEMNAAGYIALIGGVIATLGLGIGLMVLVFYSNREGYDDRAVATRVVEDDQKPLS